MWLAPSVEGPLLARRAGDKLGKRSPALRFRHAVAGVRMQLERVLVAGEVQVRVPTERRQDEPAQHARGVIAREPAAYDDDGRHDAMSHTGSPPARG